MLTASLKCIRLWNSSDIKSCDSLLMGIGMCFIRKPQNVAVVASLVELVVRNIHGKWFIENQSNNNDKKNVNDPKLQ